MLQWLPQDLPHHPRQQVKSLGARGTGRASNKEQQRCWGCSAEQALLLSVSPSPMVLAENMGSTNYRPWSSQLSAFEDVFYWDTPMSTLASTFQGRVQSPDRHHKAKYIFLSGPLHKVSQLRL